MIFPRCTIWLSMFILATGWISVTLARSFRSERSSPEKHLTYVEAATDEPSCGGTWLGVYLDGDRIQKLDYSVETSQKFIVDVYSFRNGQPTVVEEKIYRLLDTEGNHTTHPTFESKHRYVLVGRNTTKIAQLLDHADYLVKYFHEHVAEFEPRSSDDKPQ